MPSGRTDGPPLFDPPHDMVVSLAACVALGVFTGRVPPLNVRPVLSEDHDGMKLSVGRCPPHCLRAEPYRVHGVWVAHAARDVLTRQTLSEVAVVSGELRWWCVCVCVLGRGLPG